MAETVISSKSWSTFSLAVAEANKAGLQVTILTGQSDGTFAARVEGDLPEGIPAELDADDLGDDFDDDDYDDVEEDDDEEGDDPA